MCDQQAKPDWTPVEYSQFWANLGQMWAYQQISQQIFPGHAVFVEMSEKYGASSEMKQDKLCYRVTN